MVLHRATTLRLVLGGAVSLAQVSTAAVSASVAPVVIVAPGQSIQAAIDTHPPGTTLRLQRGVYRLSAPIVPKDRMHFEGDGDVTLSGARQLRSFVRSGRSWMTSRQSAEGKLVKAGREVCRATAPRCNRPEDLFIDDRLLRPVGRLADLVSGTWFFDYDADRVYLADDPSAHRVELSVTPSAFEGNAAGIVLRRLLIEKFATPTEEAAINLRSEGMVAENLEVRFNHFAGMRTIDRSVARHNHVHHNGGLGLIGAGEDILIEENEIDHNNTAEYDPYWAAGGTKWVHTSGLVVRRNSSHDNDGPGLWTDIDNRDVLFEENHVFDNALSGIFHEVGYRAVIRRNRVERNGRAKPFPGWVVGAGILVSSSSDVEVYENQVIDNWQGIAGLEDERGQGSHGPWILARLLVHDNVVRQTRASIPGSGRSGVAQAHDGSSTFKSDDNRFTGNTYQVVGSSPMFFWMGRDVTDNEWRRAGHDVTGRIERQTPRAGER